MTVIEPATVDRLMRALVVMTSTRDLGELRARWSEYQNTATRDDFDITVRIAKHLVRCRVDELLDDKTTAEGILGITTMILYRLGLGEPTSAGQLLADCTMPDVHDRIAPEAAQSLPALIVAIRPPEYLEHARMPFIHEWCVARNNRQAAANRDKSVDEVLDAVVRAAPPNWTEITGTLCGAAGLARANLRVSRPDGAVGIAAPVHIPALHDLRTTDRNAGTPWWRATIHIDSDNRTLEPTPADVPLPPMDLMRPSEYAAESWATESAPAEWLHAYCNDRELNGAPVVSPGAATDAALIRLGIDGVDADPRRVTIGRTENGYRVRALTGGGGHIVDVDDLGVAVRSEPSPGQ